MTPKEKAKELEEKIKPHTFGWSSTKISDECKQCALIAVNEIINSVEEEHVSDTFYWYWKAVIEEIEKL